MLVKNDIKVMKHYNRQEDIIKVKQLVYEYCKDNSENLLLYLKYIA